MIYWLSRTTMPASGLSTTYLWWRIRTEWRLWKRKRARKTYSEASKRGAATEMHNRFINDRLIRERMA